MSAPPADLVESERLYRSTFDEAPVGIVHVSPEGRWLRVNRRLCDFLGYARDEVQGMASSDLVHPAEVAGETEAFRRMVAGTLERQVVDERRYRRKDGSFVWARVNTSVHTDPEGHPHFISVIEDITERRALEAQVRQVTKMEAIGRLAAGVAHDFNNLLSVVISYSELLAEELDHEDPMRADLDEIKAAGLRAVDLTRQLLAFSRLQVLSPQVVDLADILTGMENVLRRLIGEDVELTAAAAPGLGKILVDPGQMEQIILSLAVNARDAMPLGGALTIETAEVVLDEACAREQTGAKPGPHVMLIVSDTGAGMDEATLARVFEPFFTTKEVGKGAGLGLATVFGIVRQSGGTICVDSEPGKGTTFKVFFPTASQDTNGSKAEASSPAVAIAGLHGTETILLVDDEERVRSLARTILSRYGYTVLEAQSGGDAFLLCEQHPGAIHLLLTDVVMPRMSGRQLVERLSPIRPEMKVLYMSGYTDDSVLRHGIRDSTVAFLQKPISPDVLVRKVRETLSQHP